MANTRQNSEGEIIGDPNQILDYIPRQVGALVTTAETANPTPEELFSARYDWIPGSRAEITMALDGLPRTISTADRFGGIAAVESSVRKAQGFRTQALRSMLSLREAFIVPNESDSLSPDGIRDSVEPLPILAAHQIFKHALAEGKWPRQGKNLSKKVQSLVQELHGADDQTLLDLWQTTFRETSQRERFWGEQLNEVHNNPRVREARLENEQRRVN